MLKAKYGWNVLVDGIISDQDIFYHILKNRGIDDADRFFSMGKESLHNPYLFQDMQKAVNRILMAISASERILIYGDYDCDGITAISVLYRALKIMGANVDFDLPDRFSEGYGLNMNAVGEIIRKKYQLIITVDNGITCLEEIAELQSHHIDCIVTDHHEPKATLPNAFAIIHAKTSINYPWKELAGVAVAYKLACALTQSDLDDLLDLVMIGTIADLMPLKDENQALVNLGLNQFQHTQILGLKKLIQFSHLDQLNETAIAFKIAPKINSSGRLGKAKDAVRLLITNSEEEANRLIMDIESNHSTRKDLTEEAVMTCERLMENKHNVLVIASHHLHEGVIGICAQKMTEKYQKTTCVITIDDDGIGKGSCRSFGNDNILEMLDQSKELLLKYGGHSQAAGLTLRADNIDALQERLDLCAKTVQKPILEVDMEVDISTVSISTVSKLEKYSFFTGTYLFRHLIIHSKVILGQKHTKLYVEHPQGIIEAIIFNHTDYFYQLEVGDVIDIVGGLSINQWKNRKSLQILIKDLRCNEFQVLDHRSFSPGEVPLLSDDESCYRINSESNFLQSHQLLMIPSSIGTVIIGELSPLSNAIRRFPKELMADIYRFINQHQPITFSNLCTFINGPEWMISSLLLVLKELDLVKESNETYSLIKPSSKRDVNDSKTYQTLLTIKNTFDWLSRASIDDIRKEIVSHWEETPCV